MFSKLKSVLISDTQEIEDIKVENSKKSFLEQEYEKKKKFFKLTMFVIGVVIISVFGFLYVKYEKQVKIFQSRVYVTIFGFKINPKDYKISGFDHLNWWGQTLFLKDVKTLAESNKYNEEKFKKLVKQYQKMWQVFVKTKDVEKFKNQYAKFWGIEDLIGGHKREKSSKERISNGKLKIENGEGKGDGEIDGDFREKNNNISSGNIESSSTGNMASGSVISTGGILTTGLDLSGQVLSGNNLSGEMQTGFILTGNNLTGNVIISGDILTGLNQTDTKLSGLNLTGQFNTGVVLTGKNLSGSIIVSGENLTGTK